MYEIRKNSTPAPKVTGPSHRQGDLRRLGRADQVGAEQHRDEGHHDEVVVAVDAARWMQRHRGRGGGRGRGLGGAWAGCIGATRYLGGGSRWSGGVRAIMPAAAPRVSASRLSRARKRLPARAGACAPCENGKSRAIRAARLLILEPSSEASNISPALVCTKRDHRLLARDGIDLAVRADLGQRHAAIRASRPAAGLHELVVGLGRHEHHDHRFRLAAGGEAERGRDRAVIAHRGALRAQRAVAVLAGHDQPAADHAREHQECPGSGWPARASRPPRRRAGSARRPRRRRFPVSWRRRPRASWDPWWCSPRQRPWPRAGPIRSPASRNGVDSYATS